MHELIQSEIQSDIIREKSLLLPAEVFRFRSVPFREIYPTSVRQYKDPLKMAPVRDLCIKLLPGFVTNITESFT